MANEDLKEQKSLLDGMAEATSLFTKGLKEAISDFHNMNESIGRSSALIADLNTKIGQISPIITAVSAGIFGASKAFSSFKVEGSTAIANVSKQFHEFIKNTEDIPFLKGIASSLNIDISKFTSIKALKQEIISVGGNFLEAASSAQEFQTNLLRMLANTGNLSSVMRDGVIDTELLNEKMVGFSQNLTNIAKATGFSTSQVAEFATQLGKIPGTLESVIKFTDSDITRMTALEAATKLATGSGQNLATVTSVLNDLYQNLGVSGRDAMQTFALIGNAAEKLKLRFDDVKSFTIDVSNSLKFFGNETEGSLKILNRYSDALRETGLGAKASQDMIEGMVKSVGNLTTGTKAFLSARSGGPGGLQGAFQIDKMLREGKIDEVVKMMENNLRRQLGGRIVSLDEASRSQSAAAQYQKQLSLAQSGAFGNMFQGDQAKAERFFDAMAKGDIGKAGELLDSSKALENTVKSGSVLQEQQVTLLSQINAGIDAMVGIGAIQAKGTSEKLWSAAGEGIISKYIKETSKIAQKQSSQNPFGTGMTIHQGAGEAVYGAIDSFYGLAKEALSSVISKPSEQDKDKKEKSSVPKFKEPSESFKLPVEKFEKSTEVFKEAVDKINMPKPSSLTDSINAPTTATSTKLQETFEKSKIEDKPLVIQIEGVCMDCGDKKIQAKIDKAQEAQKQSVWIPGSKT